MMMNWLKIIWQETWILYKRISKAQLKIFHLFIHILFITINKNKFHRIGLCLIELYLITD